jgi:hypothetical protein
LQQHLNFFGGYPLNSNFLHWQTRIGVGVENKKLEVKEYPKKNFEMPLQ